MVETNENIRGIKDLLEKNKTVKTLVNIIERKDLKEYLSFL
jgi:hypothetical protein